MPLPNGLNGLYMGVTNHLLTNWDDPPSITLWEGEEMSLNDLDGVVFVGEF